MPEGVNVRPLPTFRVEYVSMNPGVSPVASVPDVIAKTDLLVVAPSRVARAFAGSHGLKSRELPIPVPAFSVRVHWSARHEANAAHAWMRELLR